MAVIARLRVRPSLRLLRFRPRRTTRDPRRSCWPTRRAAASSAAAAASDGAASPSRSRQRRLKRALHPACGPRRTGRAGPSEGGAGRSYAPRSAACAAWTLATASAARLRLRPSWPCPPACQHGQVAALQAELEGVRLTAKKEAAAARLGQKAVCPARGQRPRTRAWCLSRARAAPIGAPIGRPGAPALPAGGVRGPPQPAPHRAAEMARSHCFPPSGVGGAAGRRLQQRDPADGGGPAAGDAGARRGVGEARDARQVGRRSARQSDEQCKRPQCGANPQAKQLLRAPQRVRVALSNRYRQR